MALAQATGSTTGNHPGQAALPSAVLEGLAARFRPGGLALFVLGADGSLLWSDGSSNLFFQRYVLPMVHFPEDALGLARKLAAVTPTSAMEAWNVLPGVVLAAFPHIERRQLQGIVLLAAKSGEFKLGEDVLRMCGRLGLDATWLAQQADALPVYTDEAILRAARLLVGTLRDQVRLAELEHELDSLSGQLANTYEELSLIYQLSSGMRVTRSATDFFKQACLDVMSVLNVRGIGVWVCDSERKSEPLLYGSISLPPGKVHELVDQLTQSLKTRKTPLLSNDLKATPFHWLGEHASQLLAVPLSREDHVLGCMFALDKQIGEFDSVDAKLLNSIANESAVYLENAMLFDGVHGLMMGLLHSLTSAVDAKDAYTCGHSERVALLSRRLAQEAGLGEQQVERIYMAGLLHDVGKIGVPEAVLQKTGKLTPEEFEQMKKHPEIGARILQDIRQIRDLIPGVLYHHERFDGRGYPAGLSGEGIPLMGRIICLADCFDAMTSNRTYRKALPLEVAMIEIRRCGGTQFDPKLSERFLRIGADEFRKLLANHQEQTRRLVEMQQTLRSL